MIATLPPSEFAILYRFAAALVGENPEAERLVHDVVEEKFGHLLPEDTAEGNRKNLLALLKTIWEQRPILKKDEPASHLPPIFQWVPVEERATLSLRALAGLSDHEILAVCGPGAALGPFSSTLTPEKVAQALENVPVSQELLRRLAATAKSAHPPFRLSSPLGLSLLFGALVLLAVGTWIWRDLAHRADERLVAKFVSAARQTPDSSLDPVDFPLGELSEILFLKHGIENFSLPQDLLKKRVNLLGITTVEGHRIVQVGFEKSHARLMLFRSEDFGLDPNDPFWRTADTEGWSVALRTENGQGHILALYGSPELLQSLLPD